MFFNDISVVLFLDRDRLSVFSKGNLQKLDIPKEVYSFLSVLDKDSYEKLIDEFFKSLSFSGQKGVIVLAKDLIFTKKIPKSERIEEEKKNFYSKVPLETASIAKLELDFGEDIGLMVTSSEMYLPIVESANNNGLEIVSVVPAVVFEGLSTAAEMDEDIFGKIVGNKSLLEADNFLSSEGVKPEIEENKQVKTPEKEESVPWFGIKKNIIMLAVTILLFLVAGVLTLHAFKIINLPFI